MKIPEEMKKNVVLNKSDPTIGTHSGQNGDVQPKAKIIDPIVINIAASIHRPVSDILDAI
jgi:hypothetical protein